MRQHRLHIVTQHRDQHENTYSGNWNDLNYLRGMMFRQTSLATGIICVPLRRSYIDVFKNNF